MTDDGDAVITSSFINFNCYLFIFIHFSYYVQESPGRVGILPGQCSFCRGWQKTAGDPYRQLVLARPIAAADILLDAVLKSATPRCQKKS